MVSLRDDGKTAVVRLPLPHHRAPQRVAVIVRNQAPIDYLPITEAQDSDLGRQLCELIGAVGLYLGELGSEHEGDKDRLRRALQRALRSRAHIKYMKSQ